MKEEQIMIYTSYKKIDEAGRVVISKDIRRKLSLKHNDILKIDVKDNVIVIKKAEPSCEFCESEENLLQFKGKTLCRKCLEEMKEIN